MKTEASVLELHLSISNDIASTNANQPSMCLDRHQN